jgi:hypothetical protein
VAHKNNNVIVGIPASITFRSTPCDWKQAEHKNILVVDEQGRNLHPLRLFEKPGNWLDGQHYEAWSVRANFLSLTTDEQFLEFLNKTGYFSNRQKGGVWSVAALRTWQRVFVELLRRHPSGWVDWVISELRDNRDYYKRLIVVSLQFHTTFKIKFGWEKKQHRAVLETDDTLTAILATIYLDQLRGAKFGFCARSDCRKGYEVESKHKRKYCSQYCAHLESVRRLRRRTKKRKTRSGS